MIGDNDKRTSLITGMNDVKKVLLLARRLISSIGLIVLIIMLKIRAPISAPAETIPIKPKLSFPESTSNFLRRDMLSEIANIKGTAKEPVVAPAASKVIASKSGGDSTIRIKTTE